MSTCDHPILHHWGCFIWWETPIWQLYIIYASCKWCDDSYLFSAVRDLRYQMRDNPTLRKSYKSHFRTVIHVWISDYMPSKVWDEITYPVSHVSGMDKQVDPMHYNGSNYFLILEFNSCWENGPQGFFQSFNTLVNPLGCKQNGRHFAHGIGRKVLYFFYLSLLLRVKLTIS